jgi:hypothetical protein
MTLWTAWMTVVLRLRPAFSRERTFLWFVMALSALSIRPDLVGVTSFVRSHCLEEWCYNAFRRMFHSSAVRLDDLRRLWTTIAFEIFQKHRVEINGGPVLICDGLKTPKEGRKMPAVKSLHQESTNNSKPEYIMGHSWQVVSLLVRAAGGFFAVPLVAGIGEGVVFSNRDQRTQLDFLTALLDSMRMTTPFYLVADAYYACRKVGRSLLAKGCHLISRMRITAVAYEPFVAPDGKRTPGRPRIYGEKIKLKTLFDRPMTEMESPYSGENGILKFCFADLIWRPLGRRVRFIAVDHPRRGKRLFFSSDLTLSPEQILLAYSWRFKIEVAFRQAVHVLGTFAYHFWMKMMKRIKKRSGDQYLHRTSDRYRSRVRQKLNAYEIHVQIGMIAQGLLQSLACLYADVVWKSFRGWIKTIRPGLPPSELVVTHALRDCFGEFLLRCGPKHFFRKFIADKIDPGKIPKFTLAA